MLKVLEVILLVKKLIPNVNFVYQIIPNNFLALFQLLRN